MADEKARVLYCGNLSEKVTEDILYELFLQAGPIENVALPKDKDGKKRNFAFITFKHEISVPYSLALMNGISLYGKQLRLELRTGAEADSNRFLENLLNFQNSQSVSGNEQGRFVNDNAARDSSRGIKRRYQDSNQQSDNQFQNYPRSIQEYANYSGVPNFSPQDQRFFMMQPWQMMQSQPYYAQTFSSNSPYSNNVNLNLYPSMYLNPRRF